MDKTVFDVKVETLIQELDKSTDPEKLAAAFHMRRLAAMLACSNISHMKNSDVGLLIMFLLRDRIKDLKEILPEGSAILGDFIYSLQILGYEHEYRILRDALSANKKK